MAKHREISQHSIQARTLIGGMLAASALLVAAPAGSALAAPGPDTETAGGAGTQSVVSADPSGINTRAAAGHASGGGHAASSYRWRCAHGPGVRACLPPGHPIDVVLAH